MIKQRVVHACHEEAPVLRAGSHDNRRNSVFVGTRDQGKRGTKRRSTDQEHDPLSSDDDTDASNKSIKRTGKLISGKLVKVDDLDIKVQVRYPHTRLNGEFTMIKEFDKLPLNLFTAGELETIQRMYGSREGLSRIQVLLVILYYSQFLDIKELRDQYDGLMKQIERNELKWSDSLADRMDRALDRRIRLRDQCDCRVSTSVNDRKSREKERSSGRSKEEFVYCMAFNKGNCAECGTHKGRFAGREGVTLNHACRKCLQEKGLRVGHAEIDDRCPYKIREN